MSIKKDLAIGAAGEKIFRSLVTKQCGMTYEPAPTGKFSDWDAKVTTKKKNEFTCEIKYDIMGVKTGNLAIEMWNPKSDKPSGLSVTKADLWVHILTDIYAARVDELKRWVDNNTPVRVIEKAGDGNATIYLYPVDIICGPDGAFIHIDVGPRASTRLLKTLAQVD